MRKALVIEYYTVSFCGTHKQVRPESYDDDIRILINTLSASKTVIHPELQVVANINKVISFQDLMTFYHISRMFEMKFILSTYKPNSEVTITPSMIPLLYDLWRHERKGAAKLPLYTFYKREVSLQYAKLVRVKNGWTIKQICDKLNALGISTQGKFTWKEPNLYTLIGRL